MITATRPGMGRESRQPQGPGSASPSGGHFMIMGSFDRIATETVRDHEVVPGAALWEAP